VQLLQNNNRLHKILKVDNSFRVPKEIELEVPWKN
jgi:hypothetical protein